MASTPPAWAYAAAAAARLPRPALGACAVRVPGGRPRAPAALGALGGGGAARSLVIAAARVRPGARGAGVGAESWAEGARRGRGGREAVRGVMYGKGGKRSYRYEDIVNLIAAPSPHRMLIDVRTPEEIARTGRIPTAHNVPVTAHPHAFHLPPDEFADAFGFRLPKDRERDEIVFYCKAGVRSKAAAGLAMEAGWRKVGEYGGSWVDWEERGGAVARDGDEGTGKGV